MYTSEKRAFQYFHCICNSHHKQQRALEITDRFFNGQKICNGTGSSSMLIKNDKKKPAVSNEHVILLYRKCKITITGPWQKVPPIPLIDVTVLPCLAQSSLEQVPVWAISEKGDVLCRLGVTAENPAVRTHTSHTHKKLFINFQI